MGRLCLPFLYLGVVIVLASGTVLIAFMSYVIATTPNDTSTFDCTVIALGKTEELCGEITCVWWIAVTVRFGPDNDTATDQYASCGGYVANCNATYAMGSTMQCYFSNINHQFTVSPTGQGYDNRHALIVFGCGLGIAVGIVLFLLGIAGCGTLCTRSPNEAYTSL